MTSIPIEDADTVSRSILYPTHIKEDCGVLQLGGFTFNRPESVNCHRLLGDSDLHTLGVSLAVKQNQERVERGDTANRIYKGYISSVVGEIRAVREENVCFDVMHHEENGNNAHCNIEIQTTDNQDSKKSARAAAKDSLRLVFSGLVHYNDQ